MSTTDGGAGPDPVTPQGRGDGPDEAAASPPVDDAEDRWRRAVAELDNARKRCARQVADERVAARAQAVTPWLAVVDNLDRALESADAQDMTGPEGRTGAAPADRALVDGVRAVRDQAVSVLAGLGYHRHAEVRVPFDPYLHEAVGMSYDEDAEPGTVVRVLRPGYGEGERQLRPAGVVVAGQRG